MTFATTADLYDSTLDKDRLVPDDEVDELLVGGVDLHLHPAPSPFPRRIGIVDAARDASAAGFRAIVAKSHHHSMQTDVLAVGDELKGLSVQVFGGVALNRTVGGINPYAVELALRMGGRVVWFPTISSAAHIDHHSHGHASGFPTAGITLRENEPISILDETGHPSAATRDVLDVIADERAVLNCGHLPADEIDVLLPAARAAGIEAMVVSHPTFVIGADPDRVARWAGLGATIEHCLAVTLSSREGPEEDVHHDFAPYIEAAGVENTIFSSDLGQKGNPLPITAFRRITRKLLDLGFDHAQVRAMTGDNAHRLLFR